MTQPQATTVLDAIISFERGDDGPAIAVMKTLVDCDLVTLNSCWHATAKADGTIDELMDRLGKPPTMDTLIELYKLLLVSEYHEHCR